MPEAPNPTTAYYEGTVEAVYRATSGAILHLGIFNGPEPRHLATTRTKEFLATQLNFSHGARVVDLGSGYSDAARYLAGRRECGIVCVNLVHGQNREAIFLNGAAGLSSRVQVVTADFAAVPLSSGVADVVWSQEALLHAPDRAAVLQTAARLLAPGGKLIFTDILQIDAMPASQAQRIYERVQIHSLETFESYASMIAGAGLDIEQVVDLSAHVPASYHDLLDSLYQHQERLSAEIGKAALERIVDGMQAWVAASKAKKLGWGMFLAGKP